MKEHGNFILQLKGKIIYVKVIGSWNDLTTRRYCYEYYIIAEPLINTPWAELVDLTEWELDTPESEQLLHELSQWADSHNLTYQAIVGCQSTLQRFQLNSIKNDSEKVVIKYFDKTSEALNWFSSLGFNIF